MATASKQTKTVERTVTEEVTTYTLELTAGEREHLLGLTGDAEATPVNKSVYRALLLLEITADEPAPQALRVGDRVRTLAGDVVTVDTVAFTAHRVKYENGTVRVLSAAGLKPTPPADPKVEVVKRALGYWITEEGVTHGADLKVVAEGVLAALDAHSGERI